MASIVTRIELDVEDLVEHIRDILAKNPNAEIHVNPPTAPAAITVSGKAHPASATPTGHQPK